MKSIDIKGVALKAAGTTAGAVAAVSLNKVEMIGKRSGLIKGLIKIAAGAFLPKFAGKTGKAGSLVESAGYGMMAIGGIELANHFIEDPTKKFSIAGVGDLPVLGDATLDFDEDYRVGSGSLPTLGDEGDDDMDTEEMY